MYQSAILDATVNGMVTLIVATYHPDSKAQASPLPQITIDHLHIVHHILHGLDMSAPVFLITMVNSNKMAAGKKHTHRTCLQGPEQETWIEAEFDQLDKRNSYCMYGSSIPHSAFPSDTKVVRPIWNYSQKGYVENNARK
jgi:hypothetical protein